MVIEYIGSIIRNEVANRREQIYEKQVIYHIPCGLIYQTGSMVNHKCLSSTNTSGPYRSKDDQAKDLILFFFLSGSDQ